MARLTDCWMHADQGRKSTHGCSAAVLLCGTRLTKVQTNSNYFAKWCFGLGIVRPPCPGSPIRELTEPGQNLKRIEVIEDDEAEIIEAVRRMSDRYDMVVTR